jgi:hypothetical protein
MGLFGFGGIGHQMEENAVQRGLNSIGAYQGTHSENCESCGNYVRPSQTGSKYYGGCRLHQIKVFSNYKCDRFSR